MKKSNLVLLSLTFSMFFVCGTFAQESTGLKVGDIASDFSLMDVNGKMVSLADYDDAKGFLIIFSCNTCPYVVAYEDRMIDLHQRFARLGYPVIAINSNDEKVSPGDSFEKMKERAKSKNFPFPYVYDKSQEVIKAYGATRTPHVYILNKEGDDMVVKYIGAIDNNYQVPSAVTEPYVERALAEIMEGKEVSRNSTKAIGCTIKWTR